MAKRKREERTEEEDVVLSGLLLGGTLAAVGVLMYWMGGRYAHISGFDWVQMGGILLVVIGVMIFLSGGITRSNAIDWVRSLGYALVLAMLIRWPIAEPFRIPSGSMYPTLYGEEGLGKGDRVFVNKWVYGVRYPFMNKRIWRGAEPERWDLVVFKSVEDAAQHPTLVKRIVGMPGERIHLMNGRPYRFFRPGDPVPDPRDAPELDWDAGRELEVPGQAEPWLFVPVAIPDFMPEGLYYTSPSSPMSPMRYGVMLEDEYAFIPDDHYLLLGDNSANSRDGRYLGWVPNGHLVGRVACIWWPPRHWRDFTGFTETWWWRTLLAALAAFTVWRLLFGRSVAVVTRTDDDGKHRKVDHVYVDCFGLGLRIPFTQWWLAQWGTLRHGDPVVYWGATDSEKHALLLTGRVAALPGERVAFEDGKLRVNDEPAAHPALRDAVFENRKEDRPYGRSKSRQHTEVPEGHYFVLADREDEAGAVDSRRVGWVPRNHLAGRARAVWWPPARWRRL